MDVEQRLVDDAKSFAKEVASLDEEGFISRTLALLGIPTDASDAIDGQENQTPEARPRSAAGPARARTT